VTQERILIVDGDISLAEMLKTRLEDKDYLVDCVSSAKEALDILKTKWVDLVVLAVVLQGGMDGFQLFKEIRKRRALAKVPVAVQSKKPAMRKAFERLGAKTFFVKPYSVDIFLGEIRDILTKKILILGDDEKATGAIARYLGRHDWDVEVLGDPYRFYVEITTYRYRLAVVQFKIHTTTADMVLAVLRENARNKMVPVIVYAPEKVSRQDGKAWREAELVKERCKKSGHCEIMAGGYSHRQFIELAKKYLDTE